MQLREYKKKKTTAMILSAARRLFNANGYNETMMSELASKAVVSRATLYNYFPNKESLLVGIANEELDHLEEICADEISSHKVPDQCLKNVMLMYILDSMTYIDLSRRIAFHFTQIEKQSDVWRDRISKLLNPLVEESMKQGIFRRDLDIIDVVDLLQGLYYLALFGISWEEEMSEKDCKKRVNRLIDMTLSTLRNPAR